ncbi:MAG: BON domain-containing protein [Acidobacteriaceae bacterium]
MNSSTRARRSGSFRLTPAAAARLSFVLSLGLTGAATLAAAPALYAQQDAARSDLAIQTDVVKAISSYPDLRGEHITATAKNGVVTLAGTASSSTAKSQAQVVAATVDGVQSVVNNVTVTGGAQNNAQADPGDPGDQDVQQAQSTDPNQQQAPYTPQQQPKPGASGQWGQAGPPPDVQNGQIPSQPQENQQASQPADQNPGQEPAPPQQPAYGNPNGQYPPQQQSYPPPPQQGYGQQQGYNQQPYGGQGRAYAAPHLASTPLTIPPGTLFSVRTSEPLDSRRLKGGENFQMILAQDIYQGQYLVVPRGAILQGTVIGVKKPGALRGDAGFALQVTSLTIGGQNYPVATDTFATDTRGKGGYTAANTVGGAAIGALIGGVAGGGAGAGIGALIGGGAGLGASAATAGPRSIMPPETLLTFHLKAPLTVSPISLSEVQQLQASVTPRRPPRPPYPYGYPPPPPPPGYYYPYRY